MMQLALLMALLNNGEAPPIPVSLTQALALAASQSPTVAAARADAAMIAVGIRKAAIAWQPDLTASGTYDHTSAPQYLNYAQFANLVGGYYGLRPTNPSVLPAPLPLQQADSLFGTVTLTQPVFTPQGLFGLQPARAGAEAAALGAEQTQEQLLLAVSRTYLAIRGIDQLMDAARGAQAVAARREADAQNHLRVGDGHPLALLRAQSESFQARSQVENLLSQRQGALALLAAETGSAITPLGDGLADDLPLSPPSAEANQPWRATFAVRSARKAVEASQASLRLDQWLWLPSVAGQARVSYSNNSGFAGTTGIFDVSVQVSVPLYDRGQRYAAAAEERARLLGNQARLRQAEAQAHADWIAASANSEAAAALLAQVQAQAKVVAQTQLQVEASSRSGNATNLELSEADNQRFLADSQVAQQQTSLEVQRVEVAAAEGRLYQALPAAR